MADTNVMLPGWTDAELAELANLFHLARTALVNEATYKQAVRGGKLGLQHYHQRIWASAQFHAAHPERSTTAAYKQLERMGAWRNA